MKTLQLALLACSVSLVACGSVFVEDPGGSSGTPDPPMDPWHAPDGVAAPLPANGSSPDQPSSSSGGLGWAGWWVRFPASSAHSTSVTTLDGDAIVAGSGYAGGLDFGLGPVAPDALPDDLIGFLLRVSASGKLLWAKRIQDNANPEIIVDGLSRIRVLMPHGYRSYDADGQLLGDTNLGEGVTVNSIRPTADGGLLFGLAVASAPVDLGSGPIQLSHATPLGMLARLDAQGHAVSWHELTGSDAVGPVGEDGAGHLLAVTGGAQPIWDGVPVGSANGVTYLTCFNPGGAPLWSSTLSPIGEAQRAVAARGSAGMLFSGGASYPLSFNGKDVPYGAMSGQEETGVVLRVDGTGQLESTLVLGKGAYWVAPGPDDLVVASVVQSAPLGVVWCSKGVEPCDRYSLGETEGTENFVAVSSQSKTAYVAGQMRLTPGGAQNPDFQFYVMKVVH